ncbi:MAG: c-type cytochrome, partial [Chitinophagaceae bacterium]
MGSLLIFIGILSASAQKITFHQHINPIIQTHCIGCHREGGLGPFPLIAYNDVYQRSKFIRYVTGSRYMPPFRANDSFQHYKNLNVLSPQEIKMIDNWVNDGSPEGKKSKRKSSQLADIHVRADHSIITSSLSDTLSMQRTFMMPKLGEEEFRYFYIPFNNSKERYIRSISFLPGNRKLVHHSRIMSDTTGSIAGIDGISEKDPTVYAFQEKPLSDPFLFGWVPGNDRIEFPAGTGKKIFPGTNFILNMHYAPTPIVEGDSSRIVLEYCMDSVEREVKTLTFKEDQISNLPFIIKANSKPVFYMRSAPMDEDMSLISIMPHMHLLGKSFRAYAVSPDGDAIPLVDVPDWDFNWQMTYAFKNYIKIPKGSIIYA